MLRRICSLIFVFLSFPGLAAAGSGFIDTADQCMGIDKVVNTEIHLKRIGICTDKPGRVFVEANIGEIRRVFVDGKYWSDRVVKTFEISDVEDLGNRAEALEKVIKLPENLHARDMNQAANDTKAIFDSHSFQEKLNSEMKRVGEAALGDQFTSYYKDVVDVASFGKLNKDERIYLFVSSSMPLSLLRTYSSDVARLNDPRVTLVMRGFVGGMSKIGPTASFVANVIKKDASCDLADKPDCQMMSVNIVVDPLLFRRYGIDRVPAFVYVRGVENYNPDMSEGIESNAKVGDYISISGDASLKYIFKRMGDATGEDRLTKADLP